MDYDIVQKNFQKHGFRTQLFSAKEAARDYLRDTLQGQTIGFGGSATLKEMGLYETLAAGNAVVWHNKVNARDVRRLANCAGVYITSANGVSVSGEIVNIDMTGNRVAMTAFGPGKCYFVIGRNKIVPTLQDAIVRSRNIAAPRNAQRLGAKTPCAVKGDRCYDCNSPERCCRILMILDRAPMGMDCEILFVDEALGF